MHIFPTDPAGIALAGSVAGDPVTDPIELAELLDVDVDDLAGRGAFLAADRLGGLERRQSVEAEPPENAADGGGRDANLRGDQCAGMALPAQSLNPFAGSRTWLAWR
jgi:hypothetical protein